MARLAPPKPTLEPSLAQRLLGGAAELADIKVDPLTGTPKPNILAGDREVLHAALVRIKRRPASEILTDLRKADFRIWIDGEGQLQFIDGKGIGQRYHVRTNTGRATIKARGRLPFDELKKLFAEATENSKAIMDLLRQEKEDKIMNAMMRLFEPVSLVDQGNRQRAAKITCGQCQFSTNAPTGQWHGNADPQREERAMIKKFQERGWKVGNRAADHRCPNCERTRIEAARTGGVKPAVPPPKQPAAPEQPAEMGREHRRIIFEKLNELYVSESVGYADDWTDKKVAESLGCPRAWVAQIREENFGPEGGNQIIASWMVEAGKTLQDLYAVAERLEKCSVDLAALRDHADQFRTDAMAQAKTALDAAHDIERRLADVQKALR